MEPFFILVETRTRRFLVSGTWGTFEVDFLVIQGYFFPLSIFLNMDINLKEQPDM